MYIRVCVYIYIYIYMYTNPQAIILRGATCLRMEQLGLPRRCSQATIPPPPPPPNFSFLCWCLSLKHNADRFLAMEAAASQPANDVSQDSSKGGAVETGCSGLHSVIGRFIIQCYPHPLHPPPTAPPFDEYPVRQNHSTFSSAFPAGVHVAALCVRAP